MTCQRCEIDYLHDKTAVLESIVARMVNVLTYSEQSDEVLRCNQASAKELREFRERWPKKCPHDAVAGFTVDGTLRQLSRFEHRPDRPKLPPAQCSPECPQDGPHEDACPVLIAANPPTGAVHADEKQEVHHETPPVKRGPGRPRKTIFGK